MNFSKLKFWITCRSPQHCAAKVLVVLFISVWVIPAEREWVLEHLSRLHGDKNVVGTWRAWDKPTDSRELEAYNFAHNLKLPDSLPKTVPFNFTRYLLSSRTTTSQAYFDHLCKTEAGEFIFKTVDKVEGLYQMRPMPKRTEELMQDRYGFEDPADWSDRESGRSAESYVNPPWNGFIFLESLQSPEQITKPIWREKWVIHTPEDTAKNYYWRYFNYVQDKQSMMAESEETITARYGYTWRGIRRERDREFGIAGGELMVLDLQTNEVLAVRRSFAIARNYRYTGLNWEFAYFCPATLRIDEKKRIVDKIEYPYSFIFEVLKPVNHDNSRIHIN